MFLNADAVLTSSLFTICHVPESSALPAPPPQVADARTRLSVGSFGVASGARSSSFVVQVSLVEANLLSPTRCSGLSIIETAIEALEHQVRRRRIDTECEPGRSGRRQDSGPLRQAPDEASTQRRRSGRREKWASQGLRWLPDSQGRSRSGWTRLPCIHRGHSANEAPGSEQARRRGVVMMESVPTSRVWPWCTVYESRPAMVEVVGAPVEHRDSMFDLASSAKS